MKQACKSVSQQANKHSRAVLNGACLAPSLRTCWLAGGRAGWLAKAKLIHHWDLITCTPPLGILSEHPSSVLLAHPSCSVGLFASALLAPGFFSGLFRTLRWRQTRQKERGKKKNSRFMPGLWCDLKGLRPSCYSDCALILVRRRIVHRHDTVATTARSLSRLTLSCLLWQPTAETLSKEGPGQPEGDKARA